MDTQRKPIDFPSLLVGLTAGVAAAVGVVLWIRKNPAGMPAQLRRDRALNRALRRARAESKIQLNGSYKYVIFSDHHRGARDTADDFAFCEKTYLAALEHYNSQDYTLIILGDAEELWEQQPLEVVEAYAGILYAEGLFYQSGRYIRMSGNHDNAWEIESLVRQYLDPFFPGIQVGKELLFEYTGLTGRKGEILLTHGHQGTLDADLFDFLPPYILPFYRQFQNLTNAGHTSPSRDDCLRSLQDTMMYRWVSSKDRLVLIAGHTHRPVWSSLTHLDKLGLELHHLLNLDPGQRPPDYIDQVKRLQKEIEARATKYPPCNDTLKTRPCYFNAGCCRYEDGDITGIEIVNGRMALVKWGRKGNTAQGDASSIVRTELESMQLDELFSIL